MTIRHSWLMGWMVLGAAAVAAGGGCASSMGPRVDQAVAVGDYGAARLVLAGQLEQDKGERNYVLDRMRLSIMTLADGYPDSSELVVNEMFQLMRTQGVNEDKTIAAAIMVDDVLIWKGEPFEQAMTYYYVALQKAMIGDWGNARSAALGSLFLLKDFGADEKGERLSTEEIARRAVKAEADAKKEKDKEKESADGDYFDHGYQPVETNFALGYLMLGVASQALGRMDEASDNYRKAVQYNAGLGPITAELRSGGANTVLIVESGWGPEKVAYGTDNAFSRFQERSPSAGLPLYARISGTSPETVGCVCDVNTMAQDHMWNNMEDVRVAKSKIGSALVVAGAAVAASSGDSEGAMWAGLGMMLAGAIMKASARADTRHNDLLPQSVYVVPIFVASDDSTIELALGDDPALRLTLAGIDPPRGMQLLYARLPPAGAPLHWAQSGAIYYANDEYDRAVEGCDLPFILGGRCVRAPSPQTLAEYQRAGWLRDFTISDLESLYREEGLVWTIEDQGGYAGAHVLEGGPSLVCPRPGSVGYARIFGQLHHLHKPRSERCRELAGQIASQRSAVAAAPGTTTASHGRSP